MPLPLPLPLPLRRFPPPLSLPLPLPEALFEMDNVVLLPHMGSATVQTRQAMGDLTVENLERFFKDGKVVTPVPECVDLADIG